MSEYTEMKPVTLAEPPDFCIHAVQGESHKRGGLSTLKPHFQAAWPLTSKPCQIHQNQSGPLMGFGPTMLHFLRTTQIWGGECVIREGFQEEVAHRLRLDRYVDDVQASGRERKAFGQSVAGRERAPRQRREGGGGGAEAA